MEARKSPRILKPPKDSLALKGWMDQLLNEFNQSQYLETDPLGHVYDYQSNEDRELVSLIAALFSFGNVVSIRSTLREILKPLGSTPRQTLINLSDREIQMRWKNSYYRFYSSGDIQHLIMRLRSLYKTNSSIESFFSESMKADVFSGLGALRQFFIADAKVTPGIRFMFSDPHEGPSKRWHMWLRWVVRKDSIDLGLWKILKPSQLTLPLDTHVFDMVRYLGLTKSKTPTRRAALEVTERLRLWDPEDPVKYDFALCRLGVLGYKRQLMC